MKTNNISNVETTQNYSIKEATVFITEFEEKSTEILNASERTAEIVESLYPKLLEKTSLGDLDNEVEKQVASMDRATENIRKAYQTSFSINDEFSARWRDIENYHKKMWFIPAPANAIIDKEEQDTGHFAKGLNLYKLLIICFVGSFVGVLVELLWCLITKGYLESRSGLVYGPFNLLYGIGAVALTICLYEFRNRGSWISFLGGMLVGSVVEYVCSWGQELVFGSRSWDYTHMPFNINGRICLLYSIFWGILGVLWIKNIYPRMAKWILKLSNHSGKILTWVVTIFFVFNITMTMLSMTRWAQRVYGIESSNAVFETIDKYFPDERMKRIFANMEFLEETN